MQASTFEAHSFENQIPTRSCRITRRLCTYSHTAHQSLTARREAWQAVPKSCQYIGTTTQELLSVNYPTEKVLQEKAEQKLQTARRKRLLYTEWARKKFNMKYNASTRFFLHSLTRLPLHVQEPCRTLTLSRGPAAGSAMQRPMFIDGAKNILNQEVYLLEGQELIEGSGPRVFIPGGTHWAMRLESGE